MRYFALACVVACSVASAQSPDPASRVAAREAAIEAKLRALPITDAAGKPTAFGLALQKRLIEIEKVSPKTDPMVIIDLAVKLAWQDVKESEDKFAKLLNTAPAGPNAAGKARLEEAAKRKAQYDAIVAAKVEASRLRAKGSNPFAEAYQKAKAAEIALQREIVALELERARAAQQDTLPPLLPAHPSGNPLFPGIEFVAGYWRDDGFFVAPHFRTIADETRLNNWSTQGNVNPITGKPGTVRP